MGDDPPRNNRCAPDRRSDARSSANILCCISNNQVRLVQKIWSLKGSIQSGFGGRRFMPWPLSGHRMSDAFAKQREKALQARPVGIGT